MHAKNAKNLDQLAINTIRTLAMDAVQAANSGHSGTAMAMAPVVHSIWCFRHQLLLPRPYLVLTKPLRLDIQCQRAASVKIGWKYLDD